jgi:O-acetyl-ADP-ribose deacetylase (regulator of RNase III)
MSITLCAFEQNLYTQFIKYCDDFDNVEVRQGNILDIDCDAVVSPANSFGFMDGGIDQVYTDHFGPQVQKRLQQSIMDKHHGELLVGSAEIVDTDHPDIPFLISAPTMRVPMILKDTVSPYLAVRATLLLILHGRFPTGSRFKGDKVLDHVSRVAFPGLGTGVGRVPPEVCAKQVSQAILDVFDPQFPSSWHEAHNNHQGLYTGRLRNLQTPQ